MSSLRHPVGPEKPVVYWRRRLAVIAAIVIVVVVIVLIVVGRGRFVGRGFWVWCFRVWFVWGWRCRDPCAVRQRRC